MDVMVTPDIALSTGPQAADPSGVRQALTAALHRTSQYLLQRQNPAGYWMGQLEADASVSAGYIPLMYFMTGQVDPARREKIIRYVQAQQNPDGSWSCYHGGPGDLNVSIQVYFAMKLGGVPAGQPWMELAKSYILSCGGVMGASVFTRVWLALFGQFEWRGVPSIPPEIILFPNWFYFNIYEFASWSRATIMALAVVLTTQPVCPVPPGCGVDELYLQPPEQRNYSLGQIAGGFTWRNFFLLADRVFKWWGRRPNPPGRKAALHKVEQWIMAHQESDGSWGGIMLPWIYSLYALKSLGYGLDHPVIERGLKGLEDFILEDEHTLLLQPAISPVWDTAWTVLALREAGTPADDPALQAAGEWLLGQEIRHAGDWQVKNPETEPGGWAFEFKNDWYPDLDDSAVVPRALQAIQFSDWRAGARQQAVRRSLGWVLSMQSEDGGWGAFDRDNNRHFLADAPFADFMSPLDPTCADVSAHVLEFLAEADPASKAMPPGVAYLKRTQEPDGAWYGRWGVNYIYGTGLALVGLRAAGQDPLQPYIQQAAGVLAGWQNEDGGWGESCHTYVDPAQRGRGPSTASQTAWALMGLVAAGQAKSNAARGAVEYLLRTQSADGSWPEPYSTGSGFPRVFYLRYDLYRVYFPLLALARYARAI